MNSERGKGEILKMYNLNWNAPAKLDSAILGTVEIAPAIKFNVRRIEIYKHNPESRYDRIKVKDIFSISIEIDGNITGISLASKEAVIAYLDKQTLVVPKYQEIIGKRQSISKRIAPLQKKWFDYAGKLLNLAKQ